MDRGVIVDSAPFVVGRVEHQLLVIIVNKFIVVNVLNQHILVFLVQHTSNFFQLVEYLAMKKSRKSIFKGTQDLAQIVKLSSRKMVVVCTCVVVAVITISAGLVVGLHKFAVLFDAEPLALLALFFLTKLATGGGSSIVKIGIKKFHGLVSLQIRMIVRLKLFILTAWHSNTKLYQNGYTRLMLLFILHYIFFTNAVGLNWLNWKTVSVQILENRLNIIYAS
mmetsp:Transcript_9087/g.12610  ORF Transcript_9087/g.12610 Transcript_9087/m.12610 type:complete len:222 (-) Transcript_9087:39-704(-)